MLVVCDEVVSMAKRPRRSCLRRKPGGQVISAGPGGHYLDHEHTVRTFGEEFFSQPLSRTSLAAGVSRER
jgi:hypothetical protein